MEKVQEALHAGKHVVSEKAHDVMTSNAKIQDLQRDVQDTAKDTQNGVGQTTDHGVKIPDADHWLRIVNPENGHIGPTLLEDQIAREKIHSFDHERIPERVVHARGTGAHGYFKLTKAIPEYTTAGVLTDTSRVTPTFVRFSTVLGSRGSADTVRDVRGFATKFYTQEGNWDIVGNNIPVFFIQDAMKFPDVIHAAKPEPHNEVPQAQSAHNNFWDFQFLHSEATHMFMWAMSDRAIPRSFRMMQGFGVNTFTLTNANGERFFVKFHWIPELGVHSLVWDEALKLAGQDPDFHRKDLLEAIDSGAYPMWRFGIQVIPEAKEHDFDFDILDATKVWPEDLVPVEIIGEMVLNRAVDEFFTETEQAAFCTSHVVPGIGFSDDPLLQGRNFSYFDTQITRLGKNWQELPINRPICPVMNFNRDGALRHRISKGTVNYWPNRQGIAPPQPVAQGGFIEYQQRLAGIKIRMNGDKFKEHFNQAQLFYNSLHPIEKRHVVNAFAFELDHCDDPIVYERMCQRLCDIDYELAKSVAEKVGAEIPDHPTRQNHGKKAKGLTQFDFPPEKPTIKSRRVAIIIADGFSLSSFQVVHKALKAASAVPFVIGPRRGKIYPEGHEDRKDASKAVQADHHFEGLRSTMFDAIFIPGGAQSAKILAASGRAIHYVREAFGHLKTIGAVGEAVDFLKDAVILPGVDLAIDLNDSSVKTSYGVVTQRTFGEEDSTIGSIVESTTRFLPAFAKEIAKHRCWEREEAGLNERVAY